MAWIDPRMVANGRSTGESARQARRKAGERTRRHGDDDVAGRGLGEDRRLQVVDRFEGAGGNAGVRELLAERREVEPLLRRQALAMEDRREEDAVGEAEGAAVALQEKGASGGEATRLERREQAAAGEA